MPSELARSERGSRTPGKACIEKEDGKDDRDRERDDETRRAASSRHAPECSVGLAPAS